MIIRIYHQQRGDHVHMRLFVGHADASMAKCGDLCMRVTEFEIFRDMSGNMQFREESDAHGAEGAKSRRA